MTVFVLALIACLVMAVAVCAIVAVGMQGYYRDRNPRLAHKLHQASRYLNGEPPTDTKLEDIVSRH
ncbi:MAG: hypothetical protein WAX29_06250 [Propionibacterium sp.]